jgi:AcrR family transcriptional regulator
LAAPSPKRNRDDKRARILSAARRVCAQRGYDAALMETIAAEARVSKGTLYNYFASKEDLFLSTVLDGYDEHRQLIEAEAHPTAEPLARLQQLLGGMVKSLAPISDQMPVNFQVWGVVARDARARVRMFEALRAIYAERSAALRRVLREGVRAGVFRADLDPDAVISGVIATFDGFIYRSTFDPEHANPRSLRRCLGALVQAVQEGSSLAATGDRVDA